MNRAARSTSTTAAPRHPAFALVELLVVLGVITLLLSLLLPAAARSREAARRVECLSNLRQLHAALYDYAMNNGDQVPIGYRTASKQYNSMIFSTTAGNRWVLFGLLYDGRSLGKSRALFCPSENNAKFMFNTPENPWPPGDAAPTANVQAGYCLRPSQQIPDDLANPPAALQPFALPKLSRFRTRVVTRHADGINALYANGSAHWVPLRAFDQPAARWPEPTLPPVTAYNATQDGIWSALDAGQ